MGTISVSHFLERNLSSASFILSSHDLTGYELIEAGERGFAVDNYAQLKAVLEQRCGRAIADMFAEPSLRRGNGQTTARIDWRSKSDQPVRAWSALDDQERQRLAQRLREASAFFRPLMFDPNFGPVLAASLTLASRDSLCLQGGEPLIVDWGVLPSAIAADPSVRLRHRAETLEAFDFLHDTWKAQRGESPSVPGGAAQTIAGPTFRAGRDTSKLRAPLVACGIAFVVLLVSFIPGFLVFPATGKSASELDASLQKGIINGLEARKGRLEAALKLDCGTLKAQEASLLPFRVSNLRASPPASAGPTPTIQAPAARSSAPSSMNIVDRLEGGVVMVLAGEKLGSGFFVTQDLIVTNRHVVESAQRVLIAGKRFGVLKGEVVAKGANSQFSDFALLRVPRQTNAQPFVLAAPTRAMEPVISAGFPGLYMSTDPVFQRLQEGDASAASDLEPVLQSGIVNHLQHYDEQGVTLVLHSAEIAPGNSGGPLVDGCGRVVGVNTFYRTDRDQPTKARYALGSDGLNAFLHEAGVELQPEAETCLPVIAASPPSPEGPNGQASPPSARQPDRPR